MNKKTDNRKVNLPIAIIEEIKEKLGKKSEKVIFEEESDHIIVRSREFISDKKVFADICTIMRQLFRAQWFREGPKSHWKVPKNNTFLMKCQRNSVWSKEDISRGKRYGEESKGKGIKGCSDVRCHELLHAIDQRLRDL